MSARFLELVKSPCFPVVVSLFLQTMFLIGTLKSMGIFLDAILTSLNTTSTDIGVALGLFYMSAFIPSPVVAFMYHRCRNVRIPLAVGSTLISSGLMLVSCAGNNIHLAVFLLLSGMGHGILFTFLILILHDLEDANFNILFALGGTGFGVAMVLPPAMAQVLLTAYGWRGATLVLGAIALNILPCTLLVRITRQANNPAMDMNRQPLLTEANNQSLLSGNTNYEGFEMEQPGCSNTLQSSSTYHHMSDRNRRPLLDTNTKEIEVDSEIGQEDDEIVTEFDSGLVSEMESPACPYQSRQPSLNNHGEDAASPLLSVSDVSDPPSKVMTRWNKISRIGKESAFYKDPWGNSYFLVAFGAGFVNSGWHAFLIPYALQRGISPYHVLIITSAAAVGNITSRIGAGLLTHSLVLPSSLYIALCLVSCISLLAYVFLNSLYGMILTSATSALAVAGRGTLVELVPKERAPPGGYSSVVSVALVSTGIGCMLGGYITGMVADRFLTYDASFVLLAAMDVFIFIFMLPVRFVKRPNQL